MNKSKLRLIQCGVGGSGIDWLQQQTSISSDFDLVAIVDTNPEHLNAAKEFCHIDPQRCFPSLESALNADFPCDAVLTVTPPPIHVEHARLALLTGKHLLTEKPIASTLKDAKEMVSLAKSQNLQLVVSQNYRFQPPIQTLRRLLENEEVGTLGHGHLDFYIPSDFTGSFRETMEYPLLMDMAIHHFDLIRCLTGRDIIKITAWSFRPQWSWYRHQPAVKALMELEDGLPFSYSADWSARGKSTSWNGNWRLQCERGSLHLEDDRVFVAHSERGANNESMTEANIEPMQHVGRGATLHLFAEAIRTGHTIEISGDQNISSFATVIAAIRSAQSGRTIDVADC